MPVLLLPLMLAVLASADLLDQDSSQGSPQGAARELFDLLNAERTRAGMQRLVWDVRLAVAATRHSQLMAERNQFTHDLPGEPALRERLRAIPLDHWGENIAVNANARAVHDGLMHSPPHRANILDRRYDAVGIGVAEVGSKLWVTQDFVRRMSKTQNAEAPNVLANADCRRRDSLSSH
jgi:uncharacterized protein YkwD